MLKEFDSVSTSTSSAHLNSLASPANQQLSNNEPLFQKLSREDLECFARDAYLKLKQQADRIEQLEGDRKDAIAAYRMFIKKKL